MNVHKEETAEKMRWLLNLLLPLIPMLVSANMREVSFYCPVPAEKPPVIDGILDDPCWKNAEGYRATYEYFKPNPGPGQLKNTIKIVYDIHGLYLAIVNYETNVKGLRKHITDRDNPQLWTDDCAEIYFDPQAGGIGWRKFVVNALGVIGDVLRVDGSVLRDDWNGNGWMARTQINKDSWTIECFFPWEDLGATAKPGDIWMFCHVRYAWTSGKFIGTTSSPGGNYTSAGNFGYLCFLKAGQNANAENIAARLAPRLAPPWCIGIGEQIIYDLGNGVKREPLANVINAEKKRFTENIEAEEIPDTLKKDYRELIKEYRKLTENAQASVQFCRSLNVLAGRAEVLRWKILLENEFNQ